jgi:hypothetical protein
MSGFAQRSMTRNCFEAILLSVNPSLVAKHDK